MKIMLASHTHMRDTFVVGSHHLANVWAREGHEVLHLSTPVTPFHVARASDPEVRRRILGWLNGVREGSGQPTEVIPLSLLPRHLGAGLGYRANPLLASMVPSLRWYLRRTDFERIDVLLIDQPMLYHIWKYVDAACVIYRPTDVYPALLGDRSVARVERLILRASDGVICTSEAVNAHVQSLTDLNIPSKVLPNGVDHARFSTPQPLPEEYRSIPEPRVVYVGAMDERFDGDLVEAAARQRPGVHFVLIGPIPPGRLIGADLRNVHLLGRRSYDLVPAYLQHAQVGIIPMNGHPANDGRSPMKLFEYMSAGLPVLARRTSPLANVASTLVHLYGDADEMVAALDHLAFGRTDPRRAECARAAASRETWSDKARELLEFAHAVTRSKQHVLVGSNV